MNKRRLGVLGAVAAVTAATGGNMVRGPSPAHGETTEDYCAFDVDEVVEECFETFAESVEWVGFDDVPSELTPDEYFSEQNDPNGDGLMAQELPPGYAYAALHNGGPNGAIRVYWGDSSDCPSTWDSLAWSPWNNKATAVRHGICGTIKTFEHWDPSSIANCDTGTALASYAGSWGDYHPLPVQHMGHVSCLGYSL